MVYPAIVQIGLGLPTVNAQTYTPFRDFSPYSTRSVRLNIPHMSHLDTPSLPFPDNAINVDIASWSRDVGLSVRTVSRPPNSEYNPTIDHVEDSPLVTDSDQSPPLSPSSSEYDTGVDSPRLLSPSTSANDRDVDSTPRTSGRLQGSPLQAYNTLHTDLRSPSQYSDTTTVCCRTPHEDTGNPSIFNTECINTPLSDATSHTAQDTDLSEGIDSGESTTGLDPNVKPFVPGQAGNTARRSLSDDPASRKHAYADQASVAPRRRLCQVRSPLLPETAVLPAVIAILYLLKTLLWPMPVSHAIRRLASLLASNPNTRLDCLSTSILLSMVPLPVYQPSFLPGPSPIHLLGYPHGHTSSHNIDQTD